MQWQKDHPTYSRTYKEYVEYLMVNGVSYTDICMFLLAIPNVVFKFRSISLTNPDISSLNSKKLTQISENDL